MDGLGGLLALAADNEPASWEPNDWIDDGVLGACSMPIFGAGEQKMERHSCFSIAAQTT
jgi:hypothetical protein